MQHYGEISPRGGVFQNLLKLGRVHIFILNMGLKMAFVTCVLWGSYHWSAEVSLMVSITDNVLT